MASESEIDEKLNSKVFVRLEKFELADLIKLSSSSSSSSSSKSKSNLKGPVTRGKNRTIVKNDAGESEPQQPPPPPQPELAPDENFTVAESEPEKARRCECECQSLNEEVQLILAQLSIIKGWITTQFGVEIIKKSSLLNSIRKNERIEELALTLSLLPPKSDADVKSPETVHYNESKQNGKTKRKGRPPGPRSRRNQRVAKASKIKISNPRIISVQKSPDSKDPLDTFSEELGIEIEEDVEVEGMPSVVHIKDEIDLLDDPYDLDDEADPFEEGFMPDVDDMDEEDAEITETNNQEQEVQSQSRRPRRSAAKNISYSALMDSEDDDIDNEDEKIPATKSSRRVGRPRKSKIDYEDEDYEVASNLSEDIVPKPKGMKSRVVNKYKSSRFYKRVKLLANRKTPMPCDECGKVLKGPWNLKVHKNRIHTDTNDKSNKSNSNKLPKYTTPMPCDICGKVLKGVWSLKVHKKIHTDVRKYSCHICRKSFRQEDHVNLHIQRVHEESYYKPTTPVECDECGKVIKFAGNLKAHKLTHTGIRPYTCNVCAKSFLRKDQLNIHVQRIHEKSYLPANTKAETQMPCDVCGKVFKTPSTLKVHKRIHDSVKYTCHICGKSFRQEDHLNLHIQKVHEGIYKSTTPVECDECGKVLKFAWSLKAHKLTHANVRPHTCHVCPKSFLRRCDMGRHIQRVHEKSWVPANPNKKAPVECDECGKFVKKLKEHKKTVHAGVLPYTCHVCAKSFRTSSNMTRHIQQVHDKSYNYQRPPGPPRPKPQLKLMPCDECGKVCKGASNLKLHKVCHSDVREHICHICGKAFRRTTCLKRHIGQVHEGIKYPIPANYVKKKYNYIRDKATAGYKKSNLTPMVCDECGKTLTGARSLKRHKESHANIRPYICEVCGKKCRQKAHLDGHMLTHDDTNAPLKCKYCGRGFIESRNHARHERSHTGEKPFPCTFPNCNLRFNIKNNLTMHYRTHTGDRPYKCTSCDKTFRTTENLRLHKKSEHGVTASATAYKRKSRQRTKPQENISVDPDSSINSSESSSFEGPKSTPVQNQQQSETLLPTPTMSLVGGQQITSGFPLQLPPPPANNFQNLSQPFDMTMANQSWPQIPTGATSPIGQTASMENVNANFAGLFHQQIYGHPNLNYSGVNYPANKY